MDHTLRCLLLNDKYSLTMWTSEGAYFVQLQNDMEEDIKASSGSGFDVALSHLTKALGPYLEQQKLKVQEMERKIDDLLAMGKEGNDQ